MAAVALPSASVPLMALTVIVSTWLVPIGLVAVAGVMAMFALTQAFWASALSPAWASPVARWSRTVLTVTSVAAADDGGAGPRPR